MTNYRKNPKLIINSEVILSNSFEDFSFNVSLNSHSEPLFFAKILVISTLIKCTNQTIE